MGRALKAVLIVGLVAASILTGGAAAVAAVLGVSATAVTAVMVTVALAVTADALTPRRSNLSAFDPKSVNIDPASPRKMLLGRGLLSMDVRYVEPSGTNQEYVDYIVALAAHKSDAVESIYIEEDLAWTAAGGAQGKYAGYLTIEVILEAGAAAYHTVNAGATWGSTRRLTGCTTMKVRVKRSGNSKSSQSPFASGIGGRWTVIGRGMPVYDPARDSTVAGGSGSQRANDQSTWAYTVSGVDRGNNPALQLLTFLLGWKIGGVVSVGVGLEPATLDLASFATAAALCDESVALVGGGSQRRYEAGRHFSDADDPMGVVNELLKTMNAELTDDGGQLSLRVAVNDLTPAVTLTDDDFVGGFEWRPVPEIEKQYTVIRGRYSQPDSPSLFAYVDYPEIAIPRVSKAPRPFSLELTAVQDQRRAERIAKQAAQRQLYQGTFTVTLGVRGWLLRRNMVVAVTSNARAWSAKLFRVRALSFNDDATVDVVLREENAAIYAWDRNESPVVTPVTPITFDPRNANSWLMAGIAPGADVTNVALPTLPKGEWASGTVYTAGDIVFYAGASFSAKQDHTASSSNRPGVAADFWAMVAQAGDLSASRSVSAVYTVLGQSDLATFSCRTGSAGTVELSANCPFEVGASSPSSNQLRLTWQYDNGGTWTTIGSAETSASVAPGASSTLVASRTYSGTAGALISFRLRGERIGPTYVPDTAEHEIIVTGTATGQGV